MHCQTVFVALADPIGNLAEFYNHLFQLEPLVSLPNGYTEFQLPGLRLGIFKPKHSHQAEFAGCSSGGMSLCIEVDQLEAAIARVTQLGYPPPGGIITASHGREIYAYDPAGHRLILHEAAKPPILGNTE